MNAFTMLTKRAAALLLVVALMMTIGFATARATENDTEEQGFHSLSWWEQKWAAEREAAEREAAERAAAVNKATEGNVQAQSDLDAWSSDSDPYEGYSYYADFSGRFRGRNPDFKPRIITAPLEPGYSIDPAEIDLTETAGFPSEWTTVQKNDDQEHLGTLLQQVQEDAPAAGETDEEQLIIRMKQPFTGMEEEGMDEEQGFFGTLGRGLRKAAGFAGGMIVGTVKGIGNAAVNLGASVLDFLANPLANPVPPTTRR